MEKIEIERVARELAYRAARTVDRFVFVQVYLNKRFIRSHFKTWMRYW